jgi:hypothetical protein
VIRKHFRILFTIVGEWHTAVTDVGSLGWQAAPTGNGGRQLCGGNSVCGGCPSTNGDHESMSMLRGRSRALVHRALCPRRLSREECYTCTPCGIRFASRNWRFNFNRHTNMLMIGSGPSTYTHHRQACHLSLCMCSPLVFHPCSPSVRSMPPLFGPSRSTPSPSRP